MRSSDQQAVRVPADARGWTVDAIGRPILFRTTEEFLRCFGVKSTDDLPVVGEEQVEDFKIQAQEEVKYTLDETSLEEEMEEM